MDVEEAVEGKENEVNVEVRGGVVRGVSEG